MSTLKPLSEADSDTILQEMFRRVGLTKADYEQFNFSEPEWYTKHTWTKDEQEDFRNWLGKFLVNKKYVGKETYRGQNWGEYEAGKFILSYGWKATYEDGRSA